MRVMKLQLLNPRQFRIYVLLSTYLRFKNLYYNSQWFILLIRWVQRVYEQVPAFSDVCQKTFYGSYIHMYCHKREYWWEFVVCPQSSILHPKSTKLGKLGAFNWLEIAWISLKIVWGLINYFKQSHMIIFKAQRIH